MGMGDNMHRRQMMSAWPLPTNPTMSEQSEQEQETARVSLAIACFSFMNIGHQVAP